MYEKELERIRAGLAEAGRIGLKYTAGEIEAVKKQGGDPVTQADIEIDGVLKEILVQDCDGWLSEETADDPARLKKPRVWIVDPLDGTREFIEGINEWCSSIALCENGRIVCAGIYNPTRDEMFLAAKGRPTTLNGKETRASSKTSVEGATVLASRSEVRRGEWEIFTDSPFKTIAMGSVAYKLARVSAGLDDSTFTLVPKNEWDVAAGVLLIESAGGKVITKHRKTRTFNSADTLLPGLIAAGPEIFEDILAEIDKKYDSGG